MISYNNPDVPGEIIEEQILTRLPVKSLVRFRSVCKAWKTLILSSRFIQSHLTRSHLNPTSDTLLVYTTPKSTLNPYDLDITRLSRILGHNCLDKNCVKLDSFSATVYMHSSGVKLVGSVNGLVGIYRYEYVLDRLHNIKDRFIGLRYLVIRLWLWNPATQQCRVIPTLRTKEFYDSLDMQIGLGFDCDANDFKFVCVFRCKYEDVSRRLSRSYVYSSKCDSWNNITEIACYDDATKVSPQISCIISPDRRAIVNGCPYWNYNAKENKGFYVLAFHMFDVKNNMFQSLPELRFPGDLCKFTKWSVVNLKDSIATLVFLRSHGGILVDYYSFNDTYRLWNKTFSVGPLEFGFQTNKVYPTMYRRSFKNGDIIYCDYNGDVFFYELQTKATMRLGPQEIYFIENSLNYTESLASVQGMEPITKGTNLDILFKNLFIVNI